MKFNIRYFLFFLLILCSPLIYAQDEIVIAGQVIDKADQKPIENASVYFEKSGIASATDKDGYFLLRTRTFQKHLIVSMIGYRAKKIRLQKGENLGVQVEIAEKTNLLREIIVLSGENPADKLMKRVRARKKQNDPYFFYGYTPVVTERTNASVAHISRKTLNNRLFRSLQKGTIQAADSSLLLPVYQSKRTYRWGNAEAADLESNQKSILPNQSELVKELASKLPSDIDFYNNYIPVFGKKFLSPLANSTGLFYKYFIRDSVQTPTGKEYIVAFHPRNAKDLIFEGEMNIDSASLALTKISASVPYATNINYVQKLVFTSNYQYLRDSKWILKDQQIVVNLQLINQSETRTSNSFFITKNISYSDSVKVEQGFKKDTLYEKEFSSAIDSVTQTKIVQGINVLTDVLMNKYVHIGKIDWGPIFLCAGNNKIEGNRFTLSGRTGKDLFNNFTIGASAGYGLTDKNWKFGGEVQYRFKKQQYALVGLKYKDDFFQTDYDYHDEINYENSVGNGLADISCFLIHGFNEKFSRRKIIDLFYEKQLAEGINTHWSMQTTQYLPNEYVPFVQNGTALTSFRDYHFTADFRFSYKERVLDEYFHRYYMYNYYPVIHFVVEAGKYSALNQNYYLKLHVLEKQKVVVGNIGKFGYSIESGCIFGKVPFSLLEIYSSYENYGWDKLNLYLISFQQYASDAYVNVDTRFVTNGLIFNRIPLLKRLNLRELVSAKLAYGRLGNKQLNEMNFPSFIKPLTDPYLIATAGITNLLKIITIEVLMEMPKTTNPNHVNWGLRLKLDVDF
ncbi:MAG: DUF5686 family protein [Paludibacteraceae bacterium]|nr:DUF5686 family protein [Paludibacteraceae bacterium]